MGLTDTARGIVNGLAGLVGLRVVRIAGGVRDLRGIARDPVEGHYHSPHRQYLIEVPLAACRILHAAAFPCRPSAGNPFVETLRDHAAGRATGYRGSALERYYAAFRPRSAAEVLGLDPASVRPELRGSPLRFTFPWSPLPPEQAESAWRRGIERDLAQHGGASQDDGWKCWGPVSEAVGALEYQRLLDVHASIRSKGFVRTGEADGDIGATVLSRGEALRYLVSPGHHRAAALAALGYETVPLRLLPLIVRREDVFAWPNVRSGLFTPEAALAVFDRIFAGEQPFAWPSARPGQARRAGQASR